ncbi:MAG: hypothetical protein ABL957_03560 [Parvularculaceae bacterium]
MQETSERLRDLPLSGANAPGADEAWAKSPLSDLSDAELVASVAAAIAAPKRDADSSFLTHAPLELLARADLLAMVEPTARQRARRRIAAIAGDYARAGDEVAPPEERFDRTGAALCALLSALEGGDAETADAALVHLAARRPLAALARDLAEPLAPHLGAAGHAPILLAELIRVEGRIEGAGVLLRAPLRAMCKERATLGWQTARSAKSFGGDAAGELMSRLAAVRPVRSPSPYIAPTMLAVEANRFAEDVLGDVTEGMTLDEARRAILRVAAHSMLQDDPASAPYGWTHALTMPLAVLATAEGASNPTALIRIAATHALGFRATMGKARLALRWAPERRGSASLRNVEPAEAASAAYYWPADDLASLKRMLATRAATHGDAHLVKYTLASFDAAGADPQAAPLYLAATAYLGAWWDAHPDVCFE